MKVNKWVAILATGSVLAVAAPVSAQFGGLGALKKKLESAAKELEKPKTQPAQTTPQSISSPSQGGYATPTQASPPRPRPVASTTQSNSASVPPAIPAPTIQGSLLGQWVPSDTDRLMIDENVQTIESRSMTGGDGTYHCSISPAITSSSYVGTKSCKSEMDESGSSDIKKFRMRLVEENTLILQDDGGLEEKWFRYPENYTINQGICQQNETSLYTARFYANGMDLENDRNSKTLSICTDSKSPVDPLNDVTQIIYRYGTYEKEEIKIIKSSSMPINLSEWEEYKSSGLSLEFTSGDYSYDLRVCNGGMCAIDSLRVSKGGKVVSEKVAEAELQNYLGYFASTLDDLKARNVSAFNFTR